MHPDNGDIVICNDLLGVVVEYKGGVCSVYSEGNTYDVITSNVVVVSNAYASAALYYSKLKGEM